MLVRPATAADAPALARIYNQGIEDRTATFETSLRSEYDVLGWFDGVHPIVVVLDEQPAGRANDVIAFARATEYRARECYRGIFEFAVYTDRAHRRRGAALLAMRELITRAREAGAWKLVSRLFVENEGSRALMAAVGFREVGTYYRHAKLEGKWRDVVIVEKFLAPIGAIPSVPPPPGASAGPRGSRGDVLASLRDDKADPKALAEALDWARAIVDSFKKPDPDLLEAVADGFFLTKAHPAPLRAQFVELFRAYAALSAEASQDVYALLISRLGRIPIASDLDAFYEALFVVKQIARGADDAIQPHVDTLVEWMRAAVDLPAGLRGRISAGNVVSLIMSLASTASPTQEQRHAIAEIAVIAKLRHRVDAPSSLKAGAPSAPPTPRSLSAVPPAPPTPRRSVPPPLPHRRPSQPDPAELEDEAPIPLSSQDLLPESQLEAIPTPAIAFKPMPLAETPEAPVPEAPAPEAAPARAPEPAPEPTHEPPAPKSKRSRKSKKEGEPASTGEPKKKATRSRKKAKPEPE
jgi:L-amino acid N-acyltransferase YncA